MAKLLLGIDVGTSSAKVLLATPEGSVVAQRQVPHPTHRPFPGWAEQQPEDWWQGAVVATRGVLTDADVKPEQVAGIGVSGQGCAATLVDANGNVIRPAIIWMDMRSEPQCAWLRHNYEDLILKINGKRPAPYNADPALMWLSEHESESFTAARYSLTSTGYVNFRLTGRFCANRSDASILFAFNLNENNWSELLIEAFGLPAYLYPPVKACHDVIGGLTVEAAKALGLRTGTPVIAGGEDTSSAGLAIGVTAPGQALLSLGTAGTFYAAQEEFVAHPDLLTFAHVLPNQLLFGGSMVATGAALAWCRDVLTDGLGYDQLGDLASASTVGANGVIFLPYLSGELQPLNDGHARGVFFGLSLSTARKDLVRAVMEGTAFSIAHNLELVSQTATRIQEIRAVGGLSRSNVWCQILADVTGRSLYVFSEEGGAPLGNALLAAYGVGLVSNLADVADRAAPAVRTFEPHLSNHGSYQKFFHIYKELYPQLRSQFALLAARG